MVLAILRKVHAWAGLALCLLLIPMALSGAALVFKPQWLRATVPHAADRVEVSPQTAAQAVASARAAFPDTRSVTFAGPELGLHQVYRTDGAGAYLRPADGAVVETWGRNTRVVDWLFDLHHHLLAGDTGVKVAGTAGVLAAQLIVTGLIVWAPAWRNFRGRIAPAGPGRAGWIAAHRDLGLLTAPIALVIVLTGSAVALNQLTPKVMGFERPKTPSAVGAGEVDWSRALAGAQARFPQADIRMAILPATPGKPASIRLRQPAEWHANGRTVVWIDPATSRIVGVEDALAQAGPARLYNAFWPIHASKVGGLAWKVLTFLTGLSLAALSLYGAESYRRKLFPVRRPRPGATARSPA
jgi:uncharacterized iron-regulated membrane protein